MQFLLITLKDETARSNVNQTKQTNIGGKSLDLTRLIRNGKFLKFTLGKESTKSQAPEWDLEMPH